MSMPHMITRPARTRQILPPTSDERFPVAAADDLAQKPQPDPGRLGWVYGFSGRLHVTLMIGNTP
jgi:hypothetical protein